MSPEPLLVSILSEFCDVDRDPVWGRGLLDGGEEGVEPGAVALRHHGPPAGQRRAPEREAPVVVNGVVGLGVGGQYLAMIKKLLIKSFEQKIAISKRIN